MIQGACEWLWRHSITVCGSQVGRNMFWCYVTLWIQSQCFLGIKVCKAVYSSTVWQGCYVAAAEWFDTSRGPELTPNHQFSGGMTGTMWHKRNRDAVHQRSQNDLGSNLSEWVSPTRWPKKDRKRMERNREEDIFSCQMCLRACISNWYLITKLKRKRCTWLIYR